MMIFVILPFKNYTLLRNERFARTNLTADKQTDFNVYSEIRFNDTSEIKRRFVSRMTISFLQRNSSREFCKFRDRTPISRARITGKEQSRANADANTGNFVRHTASSEPDRRTDRSGNLEDDVRFKKMLLQCNNETRVCLSPPLCVARGAEGDSRPPECYTLAPRERFVTANPDRTARFGTKETRGSNADARDLGFERLIGRQNFRNSDSRTSAIANVYVNPAPLGQPRLDRTCERRPQL